jgi:hypothetical protein
MDPRGAVAISNCGLPVRLPSEADRDAFVAERATYDMLVETRTQSLYLRGVRATQRLSPNDVAALISLFDPIEGWVPQSKPFSGRVKHPSRIFERVRQMLGRSRRSWLEYRGAKDEKEYSLRPPAGTRICLVRQLRDDERLTTPRFFFQATGVTSEVWGRIIVMIRVATKGPGATIISDYQLTIRGKHIPRADLPEGLALGSLQAPELAREPPLLISGHIDAGLAFLLPDSTLGEVVLTAVTDEGPVSTTVEMTRRREDPKHIAAERSAESSASSPW